jgi:hypothetical protein
MVKVLKYLLYRPGMIFFGLILVLTACGEKFLDKNPKGVLFDENLANEEGIESLLIGAYGSLHGNVNEMWWTSPGSNWIFGSLFADDAYKGSEDGDQPDLNDIETFMLSPTNPYYETRWKSLYDGIARCNHTLQIINLALVNKSISESLSIQFRAEALFLRAYFHLEAIKTWDFIPYSDENNTDGLVKNDPPANLEPDAGETPWGELAEGIPWNRVEEDLQFAIDHLDVNSRGNAPGRANRYSALGLMARIKMYRGRYEEALPLLNMIINSGKYQLFNNFNENFKVEGDNGSEVVFQIQSSVNDGALGHLGNPGDILNYPSAGPVGCCGFHQPSQNLVNAFKTKNGLPYLDCFGLDFNEPGDDVKNDMGISSDSPFEPDTRELDPRLDWTVGRRGIPYLDWGDHPGMDWIRDQTWSGPYSPIKNVPYQQDEGVYTEISGWTSGLTAINNPVIRYVDILLMAAECEVEVGNGNLERARDLVNQIRARARDGAWVLRNGATDDGSHAGSNGESPAANYVINEYPNGGPLDPFANRENARQAVQFERRLELGMEGHRFWDLKRWGIAKSTLKKYIEREAHIRTILQGADFKDRNIRHPIPQDEIDVSEGYLTQNPGYH